MTIAGSEGKGDLMSYWTFSDVFEEQRVYKTPFHGGFGLIANYAVRKASFQVFRLPHKLGEERLPASSDSALINCRSGGGLAVALRNYAAPGEKGPSKTVPIELKNSAARHATLWRVDSTHHSTLEAWTLRGRPSSLSPAQIRELRKAGTPGAPEAVNSASGRLSVTIPSAGLALLEIPEK